MSIRKEQVFQAADELEAAGEAVNNRNIIAKIGGSHTTISPLLKEWKEEKALSESLKSVELPDNLADEINLFGAKIWREANKNAEVNNSALREQNMRLQSEIETLRDEHIQDVADIEKRHSEALEKAADEYAALKNEHQEVIADMASDLESEKTLNEASERALKDAEVQIQRLQKEVARLEEKASSGADFEAIKALIENTMKTNR